jgi:hypothetical protein
MAGHRHTPVVFAAATNSAARELHVDNNTHISRDSVGSGFGRRFYGMTRVLKQAPYGPHIKVEGVVSAFPLSEIAQMTLQCRLLALSRPAGAKPDRLLVGE